MWHNTPISENTRHRLPRSCRDHLGEVFQQLNLTAARSNAGGLGGYGAYTLSPQEIIDINDKIKNATVQTDKAISIYGYRIPMR